MIHQLIRQHLAKVLIIPIFSLVACKGGLLPGFEPTVDTVLDKTEIKAGESILVTCPVVDERDAPVETPTTVSLSPVEGTTLEDYQILATTVGAYEVVCSAPDYEIIDDSPAQFTVIPADPAKVITKVDPARIKAGEFANVTCTVYDSYGNLIEGLATHVNAPDGVDVIDHQVTTTRPGTYEITCALANTDTEKVPDVLTVDTADPVRVELKVSPDKPRYDYDALVTLSHTVYDQFDNVIKDVAYEYQVATPGLKFTPPNKVRTVTMGRHMVKVVLAAPWEHIEDSRILVVDWAPPKIVELFPPRGYTHDGAPELTVHGMVEDLAGSEVTEVTVNGKKANLQPNGYFELKVASDHGMNGLKIVAKDEFNYSSFVTRGYYYSTGWLEAGPEATIHDVSFREAAMAFLGQTALDDGDHDPAQLNDFATILELLLGLNVVELIGGIPPFGVTIPNVINMTTLGVGIQGDLEINVFIKEIDLGVPHVSIDTRDGGLSLGLAFDDASIALDLEFIVHARAVALGRTYPLLDPSTTTSSALRIGRLGIEVSFDIDMPVGGDLYVEGRDFQLEITDVSIDPITGLIIDLGTVPGLGLDLGTYDLSNLVGGLNDLLRDYLLNPLVNFITQPLIDLLEPLVVPFIADLIIDLLEMANLETTVQIPSLLGNPPVDMDLALSLSSVQFTEDGGRLGLNFGVLTEHNVPHEPLGTILRDACGGTSPEPEVFDFGVEPGIQFGARLDLVNEVLFMLWRSGMINQRFDLGETLGGSGIIDDLVIIPNAYLPPILDDCSGKQQLQIGDLFLDLQGTAMGFSFILDVWLQLELEAEIFASGNEVGIRTGKIQFMEMEVYNKGTGIDFILDMVLPMIPDLVKNLENQSFSFPIPEIPLDGVLPGLPPGAALRIGDLKAGTDTGVIVIGGNLQ